MFELCDAHGKSIILDGPVGSSCESLVPHGVFLQAVANPSSLMGHFSPLVKSLTPDGMLSSCAKSLILDLAEKLDAPGLQFGDGRLQFVGVERDRGGGLPG